MANPSIDNFEVTDTVSLCVTGTSDLWVTSDALVLSIGFKQVRDASTPARALLLLSFGKEDCEDGHDGEYACSLVTELPAAFSAERGDISE